MYWYDTKTYWLKQAPPANALHPAQQFGTGFEKTCMDIFMDLKKVQGNETVVEGKRTIDARSDR